jgi:hypothetical protein
VARLKPFRTHPIYEIASLNTRSPEFDTCSTLATAVAGVGFLVPVAASLAELASSAVEGGSLANVPAERMACFLEVDSATPVWFGQVLSVGLACSELQACSVVLMIEQGLSVFGLASSVGLLPVGPTCRLVA